MVYYVKALQTLNLHSILEKCKSLLRFGIVGCINTGIDFLIFTLLYGTFGIDKLVCQVIAYSCGFMNSFIMNKLWTFESKKSKLNTLKELYRFLFVNLLSLAVSLVILKVFNEFFYINVYVSKIAVIFITQAINYLGYKYWVFKTRREVIS
ncbi:MAG: GtrA family protein [Clostridiaceae bacterium]